MSLENWAKNSWLEKRDSDAAEIARLLAIADGRLKDHQGAVAAKLSSDVQLDLGYDAIRACATAALRAAGYRVVRGGNEHYRTIEALEFSIDPQKKLIPTLDKLRKKRNIGSYDDFGLISQGEADSCGKMAISVRKEVEEWIRKNHPDKIASYKALTAAAMVGSFAIAIAFTLAMYSAATPCSRSPRTM